MTRTLLITGGTGYLAQHLIQQASAWDTHATYYQTQPPSDSQISFHRCDLTKSSQVRSLIESINPAVIIHTACSNKSPEEISAIVPAAENLTAHVTSYRSKLIHLSTDLVFDGTAPPYQEHHVPRPLHPYGKAKAQAETIIMSLETQSLIVRSSLMYGIDPLDHQSRWLVRGIESGETIRLFTDEIRSPIWVHTLTSALLELAESAHHGILHLAGPQALNRWHFGLAILKLLGRDPTPTIIPSTIEESGMTRPKDLTFDSQRASQLLKTRLLSITDVTQHLHKRDT